MDTNRVEALKAETETELVQVEAEFRALEARRAALTGLVKAYEALIMTATSPSPSVIAARVKMMDASRVNNGVFLPKTIHVAADGALDLLTGGVVVSRSTDDNLTKRISRILADRAPERLNARQLLKVLDDEGWTTTSKDPIAVVRNTMIDIRDRVPEITREQHGNTVTYGWSEVEADQLATPDRGGGR